LQSFVGVGLWGWDMDMVMVMVSCNCLPYLHWLYVGWYVKEGGGCGRDGHDAKGISIAKGFSLVNELCIN